MFVPLLLLAAAHLNLKCHAKLQGCVNMLQLSQQLLATRTATVSADIASMATVWLATTACRMALRLV
jgi:hypothetical protein